MAHISQKATTSCPVTAWPNTTPFSNAACQPLPFPLPLRRKHRSELEGEEEKKDTWRGQEEKERQEQRMLGETRLLQEGEGREKKRLQAGKIKERKKREIHKSFSFHPPQMAALSPGHGHHQARPQLPAACLVISYFSMPVPYTLMTVHASRNTTVTSKISKCAKVPNENLPPAKSLAQTIRCEAAMLLLLKAREGKYGIQPAGL